MTELDVTAILAATRRLQKGEGEEGGLVYCSDANGASLYGVYIASSPQAARIRVLGRVSGASGQLIGASEYDGQECLFAPVSLIMSDAETLRQVFLNEDARKNGRRVPFPNARIGNWPEG